MPFSRPMDLRPWIPKWRSFYLCSKNISLVRTIHTVVIVIHRDTIQWVVHDMKPHLSRGAESTGSLTPSGSRILAPIQIPMPAPIPPSDDPDYVWDVFYHRAGLPDDYEAANVATLYVDPDIL